jgi:hypothetical protein
MAYCLICRLSELLNAIERVQSPRPAVFRPLIKLVRRVTRKTGAARFLTREQVQTNALDDAQR